MLTTSQTRFDDGSCRDMRNGIEVEVEGDLYSDGTVRAKEVKLDEDDDDD